MNLALLTELANKSVKRIDSLEADYIKTLRVQYGRLGRELEKEILAFQPETIAQSSIALPRNEQNALREDIESVGIDRGDTALQKDLTDYGKKSSLSKIDGLFIAITLLYVGLGNREQSGMTGVIGNGFTDKYFYNSFAVALDRGWTPLIKPMTNTRVNAVINSTWKGENLSSRIWYNKKQAADIAKQEIIQGLTRGDGTKDIARMVRERTQSAQYVSERLVRTEMTRVSTEAEMQSYNDLGISEYVYIATLDDRTSEICQTLDGQKFKVSEKQEGINAPPMHPNCRSTTISAETEIRARRAKAQGESIIIPAGTTYTEYKKTVGL